MALLERTKMVYDLFDGEISLSTSTKSEKSRVPKQSGKKLQVRVKLLKYISKVSNNTFASRSRQYIQIFSKGI